MKLSVIAGALCAVVSLASTAAAAPIVLIASGTLVRSAVEAPGSTPADFADPLSFSTTILATWLIDPSAATRSSTPLPPPSVGLFERYDNAILDFGAVISGPGGDELVIGYSSAALRTAFLLNDITPPNPAFRQDQFSIGGGVLFPGGVATGEFTTDRSVGDGVFISLFQLNFVQSVLSPELPRLLEDSAFPDIEDFNRMVSDPFASRSIVLRFAHGNATSSAELGRLPRMTYTAGSLSFFAFELPVEVPEPASLALFGLGLAGIGMRRRRRAA